ncbi:MAG: hypothetical protein M1837_003966 [Sclerophora amabilis]|nr:MAG: hypothetical protein M1837_003966 [Sclerophora amabilis]
MPRINQRINRIGRSQEPEDADLRRNPDNHREQRRIRRQERRNVAAERRRRQRERREAILDGTVTPKPSEVRNILQQRLHQDDAYFPGLHINDTIDVAREILQWPNVDGPVPPRIITDEAVMTFVAEVLKANWRPELKPPPAMLEREEPKVSKVLVGTLKHDCPESENAYKRRMALEREEGVQLQPEAPPRARKRGQPVYLQFQKNEIVPTFALQDAAARAVSFRWTALTPGINLQDEMVQIIIEVDDSEQRYVSTYNRLMLVHSARWRLWNKHGDPAEIAAVDPLEAPPYPNRPRCLIPFFKSTQVITFGEKMRAAIVNRGLRRLPEHNQDGFAGPQAPQVVVLDSSSDSSSSSQLSEGE